MKYLPILAVIAICFTPKAHSQEGLSGYFMKNTIQRSQFNPAFYDDEKKFTIGLVNTSFALGITGANYLDQVEENADGESVLRLASLDRSDNGVIANYGIGTIEVAMRISDGLYLNAGHRIEADGYSIISEDLVNLAIDGNAPYIGETLDLDPEFRANVYHKLYLGAAKQFGKLDVGLRLSYLSGLLNWQTKESQLALTTDPEFYQLTFNNNLVIQSSGGIDYNGLDSIETDFEAAGFGQNTGFGVDLGAAYRVDEKLTLSASWIDIGSITYSENAQTFSSVGEIYYDGVDITDYIDEDIELDLTDSLRNLLEIVETNESYSSSLTSKILVGADYQLSPRYRVGGLLGYRLAGGASQMQLALNGTADFGWLDLGLTYSMRPGSAFNLGLSTVFNLGPVQLILASDNILGGNLSSTGYGHARFGLAVRL